MASAFIAMANCTFVGNRALTVTTLQASTSLPRVITEVSMTLLDKPSKEKQRVFDKAWSINRCVATQTVALAKCKKEMQGLGDPNGANTEYPITEFILSDVITALFSSAKDSKENELRELEDELMITLKESGCFSLNTISLLIKLNAKANEKKTMFDALANFQTIQNGLVVSLVLSFLGQILGPNKT